MKRKIINCIGGAIMGTFTFIVLQPYIFILLQFLHREAEFSDIVSSLAGAQDIIIIRVILSILSGSFLLSFFWKRPKVEAS